MNHKLDTDEPEEIEEEVNVPLIREAINVHSGKGLADKQREALILERGQPRLRLEFDVFSNDEVSMWTHFEHGSDFEKAKADLRAILKHLSEFIKDEKMCPFHKIEEQ